MELLFQSQIHLESQIQDLSSLFEEEGGGRGRKELLPLPAVGRKEGGKVEAKLGRNLVNIHR